MKRVQIHSISLSSILLQFYVILCCVAIICFPINWETPDIDIKAADEVNRKKFRAVVVEHLAVGKFIFYILKSTTTVEYEWLIIAAEEASTLWCLYTLFKGCGDDDDRSA
jgi:hypothetical protein